MIVFYYQSPNLAEPVIVVRRYSNVMWLISWVCWTIVLLDLGANAETARVITTKAGSNVVLDCDTYTDNRPFELINWRLNNSKSPFFVKFMAFTPFIGAQFSRRLHIVNRSAILISHVSAKDSGMYRCKTMVSSTGATSGTFQLGTPIKLTVQGNPQALPASRKTTTEGFPAVLDCLVSSSAPTTNVRYGWTKDGVDITSSPRAGVSILVPGSLFIKTSTRTDSGVYKCTAKALDQTGTKIVTYPGSDIFLDVQYPPSIIVIAGVASASEGTDVKLPCVSKANPSRVSNKWTRVGTDLTANRYAVLQDGTLLIRAVKTADAGTYTCTPSNTVGIGTPKSTRLVVKIVPRFTLVPLRVKKVRIGGNVHLECAAVSDSTPTVTLTWKRVDKPLPVGRSKAKGGELTITDTQRMDHGEYLCLASTTEGIAKHSTTIIVIGTPNVPNITNVQISSTGATVTWLSGYDGGFPQNFEVWYKKAADTDYQWKHTERLPAGSTSHKLENLKDVKATYQFSVVAINREGASAFSQIMQVSTGSPPIKPDIPDKPLPPTNVIVNITSDGYYVSWDHDQVPGRPVVNKFVVEYREKNTSAGWIRVDKSVDGDRRVYLLKADLFEPETEYDFRVYALGKKLSEPAYALKTYVIAPPVLGKRKERSPVIPIVAGVLGSLAFVALICLVCFCFVQYGSRKTSEDRTSKKVHFLIPDGKPQLAAENHDTDDEFIVEDIQLRPDAVRFVPDHNGTGNNDKHWRRKIAKEEDFFLLSSCDHVFGGNMLDYVDGPSGVPLESPVTSPKDKVKFFGDVDEHGWFDCTLGRPASNEVRDSYDQFCRSPSSDVGSRDSLDRVALKRALYEHKGSKIHLVKKFDSNSSLQFDKGKQVRGPRFKTVHEENAPTTDAALKRSKNHPFHWSSPAVYTNGDHQGNRDSDTDSVGSLGRRRIRMNRPSSYYEGSVSLQPELRPITEQDSDSNLKCCCDADPPHVPTAKVGLGESSESSYLHLERTDSLKPSYLDQLKAWDNDSDGSVGKPYGPHPKHNDDSALLSVDSDSDNSVSPAHSLVSLSESDVDGEITRNIENDIVDCKRLSFSGEPDRAHLFRAVSYIKSIDTESCSDISEKGQTTPYSDHKLHPKNGLPSYSDSLDQLKVCDPYYQKKRPVSRTPSNASSGIFSVQVSASETNSVDSPNSLRRYSKASSRSSGASSSGFESSSTRASVGSEAGPSGFMSLDPNKASALRRLPKQQFPHLEEPYEWDREGTGSELDSASETGGFSFKPNMIANMRHLLDLQRQLGIDLDSSSSNESLSDKKKFENLTVPEMVEFSPSVSPSKYEVDNYTAEQKDERCHKLMDEYKSNRKVHVQDEKLNGSIIYQSWEL